MPVYDLDTAARKSRGRRVPIEDVMIGNYIPVTTRADGTDKVWIVKGVERNGSNITLDLLFEDDAPNAHRQPYTEPAGSVVRVLDPTPAPYELAVDDRIVAEGTLPEMLREAYGCGNARIYRAGEYRTPIVRRAGSASSVDVVRRLTTGPTVVARRHSRAGRARAAANGGYLTR